MATATETKNTGGVINTSLNYYLDPSKGGYTSYTVGRPEYFKRKFESHDVTIQDIRGREQDFDLTKTGFQHHKHTSAEENFTDEERIKRVVYPEVEELLKNVTGATKVFVFSHITRRQSPEEAAASVVGPNARKTKANDKITAVVAAHYIHIDQSTEGAFQVLRDNLPPEDVERLRKTRWGIINVWRAIKGPVIKDPLAICDARTAKDEDLVPIMVYLPPKSDGLQYSNVSRGEGIETLNARYNPDHKWYYVSGMMPDEVLLIKCFDSIHDGNTATRVPHTAFSDPRTKDLKIIRESIEVRCLVFFEDQPN